MKNSKDIRVEIVRRIAMLDERQRILDAMDDDPTVMRYFEAQIKDKKSTLESLLRFIDS